MSTSQQRQQTPQLETIARDDNATSLSTHSESPQWQQYTQEQRLQPEAMACNVDSQLPSTHSNDSGREAPLHSQSQEHQSQTSMDATGLTGVETSRLRPRPRPRRIALLRQSQIATYQRWVERFHPDRLLVHRALLHLAFPDDSGEGDTGSRYRAEFNERDYERLNEEILILRRVVQDLVDDRIMMVARRTLPYVAQALLWKLALQDQYKEWSERTSRD
jgi:hypothetical protein